MEHFRTNRTRTFRFRKERESKGDTFVAMHKENLQTQLNDAMILGGRFEHDHVDEESRAETTETLPHPGR